MVFTAETTLEPSRLVGKRTFAGVAVATAIVAVKSRVRRYKKFMFVGGAHLATTE